MYNCKQSNSADENRKKRKKKSANNNKNPAELTNAMYLYSKYSIYISTSTQRAQTHTHLAHNVDASVHDVTMWFLGKNENKRL